MCDARKRTFATLSDCFVEQQRRFTADALLRRGVLAGRSLTNNTTMMPYMAAKHLGDKFKKCGLVGRIAAFVDQFLIHDFIQEVNRCSIGSLVYKRNSSLIRPTIAVRPVPSIDMFQCLFFLLAGPVAKVELPRGCYFTGSLCCAAASFPVQHWHHIPQMVAAWNQAGDYDNFVREINEIFGEDLSDVHLGHIQEQSWFLEEDGLGPLARSDVDIIVTAKNDQEATTKIREIIGKTLSLVGEAAVIVTKNGFTIVPHFPLKHVQVIVLWTRSLLDYLLFVDLDCTALAYDGRRLYGTDRSLLAHLSKHNYVTGSMLQIRKDTPIRVGKKAQIGFGAFLVYTPELERSEQWLKALRQSIDQPPPFFNDHRNMCPSMYGGPHTMDELVDCLTEHAGSYSETKLPRGHNVPPALVQAFLLECHRRARSQGKRLIAHDATRLIGRFPTSFPVVYVGEKLRIKTEQWWREWQMV